MAEALAMLSVSGCSRRPPPVIGFAYEFLPDSGVVRVARQHLAAGISDSPGGFTLPTLVMAHGQNWKDAPGSVESAARLLAIPGLVGVVGPSDSRAALLTAPMFAEAGVVQIVPATTSRLVRNVGPWTFTLAPDDSAEGAFIAAFVTEQLHARTATIYYGNDEYGVGMRDALSTELGRRGVTLIGQLPAEPVCTRSGDALIADGVPQGHPPAVVIVAMASNINAACIGRRVLERVPTMPLVAGDGVQLADTEFQHPAGPAAHAFYAVSFWYAGLDTPASRAFAAEARRALGHEPLPGDALNYDALMLLARAVAVAGSDPEAIRRYLLSLGGSVPAYEGATGLIDFRTHRARPMYMVRLLGDSIVAVTSDRSSSDTTPPR